jgi:Fe-S-cluster containining protein
MGSCTGGCCAVFPVGGLTYAELEARYYRIKDGATIFDMVRPLAPEEARTRAATFGVSVPSQSAFMCVRWDEETRRCTRYEERPEMCSDYPYAGECDHGCGHREPDHVRFVWLALKAGCGITRWHGLPFACGVTALTFPG